MTRMKRLLSCCVAAVALASGAAIAAEDAVSAPRAESHATGTAAATLTIRSTRFGRILFAGNGRVVYGFTRDRRGQPSRCYGDCATAWPVYFATSALKAGAGVKPSLLGTVRRRDGRRQVTYNGWPLYFYAHERAGEVRCQNVVTHGGTWLVIRPSGALVR
jgi:predicted lipoprotein with Yx(FWY)xxD motif